MERATDHRQTSLPPLHRHKMGSCYLPAKMGALLEISACYRLFPAWALDAEKGYRFITPDGRRDK